MNLPAINSIKKLQEFILEVGLARTIVASPTPRMMTDARLSADDTTPVGLFSKIITEKELISVSRDLFASGHYSLAVQESLKAVEKFVASKIAVNRSGTDLMELAFSPNDPVLYWSERVTKSEIDEQKGYHRIYSGAMLGIRNPVTHEFNWIEEPDIALEIIVLSQHLLRKAKYACQSTERNLRNR